MKRQFISRDRSRHFVETAAVESKPAHLLATVLEANSVMRLRPLHDRIVVKRIEEKETTRSGIVIPDSAKEKPQEGEVMAVGRGKRIETGELVPLEVKVGDHIIFGKYSGSETKLDGIECLIMREDDVLGVLNSAA